MLIKLLKYDLKYVYKILLLLYGLIIFCAIGYKITSFYVESLFIVSILNVALKFITFSIIVATLIYIVTRLWQRFKNTVYDDESYLTHTLPISKKQIYFSKILTAIIFITGSMFVFFIASYIINGSPRIGGYQSFNVIVASDEMAEEDELYKNIEENQRLAIRGYKESMGIYFMNWTSILIFSIWIVFTGYFAIIIGNSATKDRSKESLILGIALFFLSICINYLLLASFSLFGKYSFTQLEISLIIIIYYSIISMLYYILGMKQLKNNLNVA